MMYVQIHIRIHIHTYIANALLLHSSVLFCSFEIPAYQWPYAFEMTTFKYFETVCRRPRFVNRYTVLWYTVRCLYGI